LRQALHPPAAQITLAGVLSALGDPIRLQIVRTLSDGAEHLRPDFIVPVGQSTLSHHMKMLRDAGVVFSRPEGTRCFVSLRPELEQRFPGLLRAILTAADSQ
jgi:DNA-binding transcriptional ArsR family regulator